MLDNFLRKASDEDIIFAKKESPIEKQTKITNEILSEVRLLTGEDIQTFEQLSAYVIANHKYDLSITKIIKKSGYLSLWEYDLKANPWRYNIDEFLNLPITPPEKVKRAMTELVIAKEMHDRYSYMHNLYLQVMVDFKLHYISINLDLYKNLLKVNKQHTSVCNQVVLCNGARAT